MIITEKLGSSAVAQKITVDHQMFRLGHQSISYNKELKNRSGPEYHR